MTEESAYPRRRTSRWPTFASPRSTNVPSSGSAVSRSGWSNSPVNGIHGPSVRVYPESPIQTISYAAVETIPLPAPRSVRLPSAAHAPGATRIVPSMREVVVSDVWTRSMPSWYGPGARRISRSTDGRSAARLGIALGGTDGGTGEGESIAAGEHAPTTNASTVPRRWCGGRTRVDLGRRLRAGPRLGRVAGRWEQPRGDRPDRHDVRLQ